MMRIVPALFLLIALSLNSRGQFPNGPGGGGAPITPRGFFGGGMTKLFGENSAFNANMMVEAKGQTGPVTIPAKIAYLNGKSRFEMDATKMKGGNMPPGVVEQIKAMGMAEVVSITVPEKKETYLIYPGLKSYAAIPAADDANSQSKQEPKKVEQGKETIDGHPTTKYKVTIKDPEGKEQDFMVWNASDLKGFPIKIQDGINTITFSDVKLEKPEQSVFSPPTEFKRHKDMETMMREEMMKRFAPPGAGATPPAK